VSETAPRSPFFRALGIGLTLALLAGPGASAQEPVAPAPAPETSAPQAPPVETLAAPPAAPFLPSLPEKLAGVPGTWDLSLDGTRRRCVMTLAPENGDAGRRVRFPAGCRRALPILAGVAGWLFTDAGLRLVDRNVRPILLFTARADRRSLAASVESGEVYSLVPLQIAAMEPGKPEAAGLAPPEPAPAAPVPANAPEAPAPTLAGAALPGTYALDRFHAKDVCRVALLPGPAAAAPVRVLDGCRDSGLSVFDPVTWTSRPGHLDLVARRGHAVGLVPSGEGTWRREPETGAMFVLRRVE